MATKKKPVRRKTTKRKSYKRRKVNGAMPAVVSGKRRKKRKKKVSGITNSEVGDLLLGLVGGSLASAAINKFVPIQDPKMKHGATLAVGAGAIMFGAKKKQPILTGFGAALAIDGGMGLARDFGVLQGVTDFMSGIGAAGDNGEDAMLIEMNGVLPQQDMMNALDQELPIVSENYPNVDLLAGDMPAVVSYTEPRNGLEVY